MKSYNVKCLGCGAILNDDSSQLGYVKKYDVNKTKYCQRCFNLIYYQKLDNSNLSLTTVENNYKQLDFSKGLYIFHILDVLNLDKSIFLDLLPFQQNLCFVVNKMDCLPKKYNAKLTNEFITKTVENYGFDNPKILYTSKNNNSSLKRLYQKISMVNKQKLKAIFVGQTNVGKSSLINGIFKVNKLQPELTISPYVNTTINLKKIKIDKNEIIDTPGFLSPTNITNYISDANIKKISNWKNHKPTNFFILPNQTLMFSGLGYLSYLDGIKTTFTFYFSNEIKIKRMKTINADKNLAQAQTNNTEVSYLDQANSEFINHEFKLDPNKKHNISIEGLGLISLNKGIKLITIRIRKNVGVNLNKYAII